jgi:ribosomal protein S18 acetylase RimI-like enzyme
MEFKNFTVNYLDKVVNLWNESVVPFSIYKEFTNESFTNKFLKNPYFDEAGFKLLLDGEKLIGFGHAIVNNNEQAPGFITCIAVDKAYQRQGFGTKILHELEAYLKSKGKTVIRLYFGCPINLEWYIPNTRCDHPGAPAVPFNSAYYYLLMNNGYNTNGQLDGYCLPITDYELPKKVLDKEKENEALGYKICIYDPAKHHGFEELFEALKNPGWYEAVKNNLSLEKPYPMLIVEKEGRILGWTGPMYPQPSGRGYFAGIGVHPETQGHGLGKALFCELVYHSKLYGAKYMTFFTGSDNLARNIYLYAGFKIVHSFAILRKDLK